MSNFSLEEDGLEKFTNFVVEEVITTVGAGATLWFNHKVAEFPKSGYLVGTIGCTVPGTIRVGLLETLIESLAEAYSGKGFDAIGVWVDEENVYVDAVVHLASLNAAVSVGEKYRQIAIYSLELDKALNL